MSRAFRHPLARVARVRTLVERIARADWAEANGRADEAREAERRARAALEQARERAAADRAGAFDPRGVLASEAGLDSLARRVGDRTAAAETLTFQAGQYRDAWRERDRDKRALEKLSERALERHRREQEEVERAELDEIARARHDRRRKNLRAPSSDPAAGADAGSGTVPPGAADAPPTPHR